MPRMAQAPRVRSTDHLAAKIRAQAIAVMASAAAAGWPASVSRCGSVDPTGLGEQGVQCEERGEVGDDADHGGGDLGQGGRGPGCCGASARPTNKGRRP